MSEIDRYLIGATTLTRVAYFDVTLPPENVALTAAAVDSVPWAMPVWAESPNAIRVGQAFWVIESEGSTIVVDPCCASDDFLRTGAAAHDHQDAAFAAFRAAGFDPAAVDAVIMSHLDGIGMNALVDGEDRWQPAFPNAPILVSDLDWARIVSRDDVSGAAALTALHRDGHVEVVTLPHAVNSTVTMELAGGHTAGMATVVVRSEDARALFLGHLAINPVHAAVDIEVVLHDDPARATAALVRWLGNAAEDDALVIGPLWPAPGAARVTNLDPIELTPAT